MQSSIFHYFRGPLNEMASLSDGERVCDFCQITGRCFELGPEKLADRVDSVRKVGCLDCLKKGRFYFSHETEIGFLSPKPPLLRKDSRHGKSPGGFNRAALGILLRTPNYTTWQTEEWLVHCNDFMIYLGEWKPADFHKNASTSDGRQLFLEMTDKSLAHLWDEATVAVADGPIDWYATYYAFQCSHCGAFRGNWDCA